MWCKLSRVVIVPFKVLLVHSELLHLIGVAPHLLFLLTDMPLLLACDTCMVKWNEGLVIKYVIMF
jgi:hypothetical protein